MTRSQSFLSLTVWGRAIIRFKDMKWKFEVEKHGNVDEHRRAPGKLRISLSVISFSSLCLFTAQRHIMSIWKTTSSIMSINSQRPAWKIIEITGAPENSFSSLSSYRISPGINSQLWLTTTTFPAAKLPLKKMQNEGRNFYSCSFESDVRCGVTAENKTVMQ